MELLAPAFDESLRTQAYVAVQDLQERLGEINDLASAQARLQRWLEQANSSEQAAYLQQALSREQQRLEQRRREFLAWWNLTREAELRRLLTLRPVNPADA
jgi:CHAD domain-containing protein